MHQTKGFVEHGTKHLACRLKKVFIRFEASAERMVISNRCVLQGQWVRHKTIVFKPIYEICKFKRNLIATLYVDDVIMTRSS
jgi:hypothetical protein